MEISCCVLRLASNFEFANLQRERLMLLKCIGELLQDLQCLRLI